MLLSLSFWEFLFLEDFRVILDESLWVEFQFGNANDEIQIFLHFHLFLFYCFFLLLLFLWRFAECIVCCTVDLWRLLIIKKIKQFFLFRFFWLSKVVEFVDISSKKKNFRLLYLIQNANQQVKTKPSGLAWPTRNEINNNKGTLLYYLYYLDSLTALLQHNDTLPLQSPLKQERKNKEGAI
jgi:hypothetical protein